MGLFSKARLDWYSHANPDGSKGGMVSVDAEIDDGVHIPVSAVVMPNVHVTADMEIENGALVTSEGSLKFTLD
ncbi:hypothetical protein [Litoreibacter roseus]|uniref:Uncharacterized protein n=1 Tax=Litoreibacter roseus TaxID=2601869 RepID=A0A6N6JIB5_9RHOB|nr:hypothetical protein [Litoreibacter roseus]GFE65570.1 hypothetical protein KIN_26440 [Litoreibacter roseus]